MTEQKKVAPFPKTAGISSFPRRAFADEEVWEIREMFGRGESKAGLCRRIGCSRPTLNAVLHGTGAYKGV